MATPRQIEANRRNAQKSTGPRTKQGKERSRFNGVKHGMTATFDILPGEDAEAYGERLDAFMADLKPRDAFERELVERIVRASWLLDRDELAHVVRLTDIILEAARGETAPDEADPQLAGLNATSAAVRDKTPDYATTAPPTRSVRTDIPLDAQARQTAERVIPFIQQNGTAWIKERSCLSCHYSGYMLWSLRDAGQRGFTVDQGKLAECAAWGISQSDLHGFGFEGAAQMLNARDRSDQGETTRMRIESLRDVIVSGQAQAGFWTPGGQLPSQKRLLSETTQVSTVLYVLALDSLDKPNEKGIASRDKGLTWVKQIPPNGEPNENRARPCG
jgi:hypothetical protein